MILSVEMTVIKRLFHVICDLSMRVIFSTWDQQDDLTAHLTICMLWWHTRSSALLSFGEESSLRSEWRLGHNCRFHKLTDVNAWKRNGRKLASRNRTWNANIFSLPTETDVVYLSQAFFLGYKTIRYKIMPVRSGNKAANGITLQRALFYDTHATGVDYPTYITVASLRYVVFLTIYMFWWLNQVDVQDLLLSTTYRFNQNLPG